MLSMLTRSARTARQPRIAAPVLALVMCGLGGCMTPATYNAGEMAMQASGVPSIPAFLPRQTDVPRTASQPIDGVWTVSTLGKNIRIEGGRAYAVDGWLHAFVLQVQPGHVVMTDVTRAGPGQYTAQDLPLMGKATLTLQADGSLQARVASAIPATYALLPAALDDPSAMQNELAAVGGRAPAAPPAPSAPSRGADPLATCADLGTDPDTDEIICLD